MDDSWTILELAERAAEELADAPAQAAVGGAGPAAAARRASTAQPPTPDDAVSRANGRVRDVPNERLIRWYVTVGLVDPPLSRRGRIARYGRRHLLQLVAVKRRQAEGRSLAEIQAELAGATDEALATAARMPGIDHSEPHAAAQAPDRFWARHPAPSDLDKSEVPDQPAGRLGLVRGIRLAPGVVLLLEDADRDPGPDDVTGIATAARPLLKELADRGLRPRRDNRDQGALHDR
jgi:DNA-binding transcriptional MerR regulator